MTDKKDEGFDQDGFKEFMVRSINNKLVDMMHAATAFSPAELRSMFQLFKDLEDECPQEESNRRELTSDDKEIIIRYTLKAAIDYGFKHTDKSRKFCKEKIGYVPE